MSIRTRGVRSLLGSGAFLVRAMTDAMDDCDTEERNYVKRIKYLALNMKMAFGLSSTNMLIHGDGNSNIIQFQCLNVENG